MKRRIIYFNITFSLLCAELLHLAVVIQICQTGLKTGNILFIEAQLSLLSSEVCRCTFQHQVGGNVEVYAIPGSTICGITINFYSSDFTHLYKVAGPVDYDFNRYIAANDLVTFNMSGEGEINVCLSIRSSVQESLITAVCTQKAEIAPPPPTTTPRAPSSTRPSSQRPKTDTNNTTQPSPSPTTTPNIVLAVVGGVAASLVVVVTVISGVIIFHRCKQQRQEPVFDIQPSETHPTNSGLVACRIRTYDRIQHPRQDSDYCSVSATSDYEIV